MDIIDYQIRDTIKKYGRKQQGSKKRNIRKCMINWEYSNRCWKQASIMKEKRSGEGSSMGPRREVGSAQVDPDTTNSRE
jgi:hypothetical protein